MQYPKEFMRMSELTNMGIPEELLRIAYRSKGQRFAMKISAEKSNSPIIFETGEFEKWRMARLKAENMSLQRG